MKKLIIVEDFESRGILNSGWDTRLVAITPLAMEKLNRYGYAYTIPGDYYVWHEDPVYTRKFQEWLASLDVFLKTIYPELEDIRPPITVHCVAMLKNVVDAFTRKGKQFQAIMNKENSDEVYYLGGSSNDVLDDELYFKGKSLFKRFAKTLGDQVHFIDEVVGGPKSVTNWRDNAYIRAWYDTLRYCMFLPSYKRDKKYLFASPMGGVRTFKLKGKWCDVACDSIVSNYKVDSREYKTPYSIVNSIENFTGFSIGIVERVLESRLDYFVNVIVQKILKYKLTYQKYLYKNSIDCVIFTRRNKLYQYGLLLAARDLGIPTVYVKHGWDAYDSWCNDWNRLRLYDYFVTHNELDREFFKKRVEENNWDCEVV